MTNTDSLPDKVWFQEQLERRAMSQRQLAALMGVDPVTITYLLNGQRKLSLENLKGFSDILGIPVEEIMRRWGFDVGRHVQVPVRGYVNDDCTVTPAADPLQMVPTPPGVNRDGYALQIRSPGAGVSIWDGMLAYIPSTVSAKPAEIIGHMTVVQTSEGQTLVGLLTRGYSEGTYNITHPVSGQSRESVSVNTAVSAQWFRSTR